MDKIYEFRYTPCIHESGAVTISIHRTKKGAQLAMDFHKEQAREEFEEMYKDYAADDPFRISFGEFEDWDVVETEIQE